jgi:endonuclease G
VSILITTAALLLAILPALHAEPLAFGLPACSGPGREFADRAYFLLCHDSLLKVPAWVGYELTPARLVRVASRPSRFRPDLDLAGPSASDDDYRHSGYTRGHMAPAADFAFSEQAIRRTFLLSNVIPQPRRVNCGRWAHLEAAVRRIAAQSDSVVVFTGSIFESQQTEFIGSGKVAVPSHVFKVVLARKGDRKTMFAVIIPNSEAATAPLYLYTTTVDEVERRTRLDFFAALDDAEERRLESSLHQFPPSARN